MNLDALVRQSSIASHLLQKGIENLIPVVDTSQLQTRPISISHQNRSMSIIMAGGKQHNKRHRRPNNFIRWIIPYVVAVFSLVSLLAASIWSRPTMSTPIQRRHFQSPPEIPFDILKDLDAILVLGGGVPENLETPPVYVQRRASDAAAIVHRREQLQVVGDNVNNLPPRVLSILCLSAGTAHLPQLMSSNGLPIWESTSCAAYLAQHHGLVDNVFVETTSYDTIGNAFFARTSHTDVNGWRNLLIITNEFHMARTAAIFDWIFLDCNTNDNDGKRKPYQLYYLSSPNVGLSEDAISARRDREEESARNVRENLATKYNTLALVWKFLNKEHSLYTASKLVVRARGGGNDEGASEMVKKSYGASR